jgi:hypothetical protein
MSSITRSLYESRWKEGYCQLFSYFVEIPAGQTVDYVLDVGESLDYVIRAFILEASGVEIIEWQSFVATQYTDGTGVTVNASPRNSRNNKASETKLVISPTIISDGVPLVTPARELLAQNFAGSRFYMRQNLLGSGLPDELLLLQKSLSYMVRITNTDNSTAKVNLIAEGWNQ